MDGQRRIPQSLRRFLRNGGDCAPFIRATFRSGAVFCLMLAMIHGAVQGGHFNQGSGLLDKLPGELAGFIGLAAEDIEISGLEHHEPGVVLNAMSVKPGGSLLGFSPTAAKAKLEALDWVEHASVRREFPNRLNIAISERQAFAIWQMDGTLSVIDHTGVVMSDIKSELLKNALVVTGEGANVAAEKLVNQLEAVPDLKARVRAASRLGMRRWNLYLDNGTKIMLPAENVDGATRELLALAESNGLLSGAAAEVDLRVPGTIRVAVAVPEEASPETTASITGQ